MTEPINDPGLLDTALHDRAMDWVLLLRSGQATTDDAEALQRWRHQSDLHEQAFVQAVRVFRDLGALGAQLERRNERPFVTLVSTGARRMASRRGFIGGAIAASVAGYMLVDPPLGMWPSLVELSADYRTAKGEQRDVLLAENVSAKLNTQTSLSVRSEGNTARVELITGEAAVTAKRQASDPLILVAGNGQISSTSAEFNVRCIDGAVQAICMDGAMTISQHGRSVQLLRGQQASYSSTEAVGAPSSVPDAVRATAWREKLLIFRDQPLAGVVSEVNRYRPGKIVVTNSDLGRRLVNGTFHTDKLDDFVAQVRQLFGADVRSLPGGIVLLS